MTSTFWFVDDFVDFLRDDFAVEVEDIFANSARAFSFFVTVAGVVAVVHL